MIVPVLKIALRALTRNSLRGGTGTTTTLTPEDVEAILREAPAVAAASPSIMAPVTLVFGNQSWTTRADGVDTSFPLVRARGVASGQFFTDADIRSAARVAVIGQTVTNQLFAGMDPVGQTIRARNLPFRVAGVLEVKGQSTWGQDQDDLVVLP